MKTRNLFLSLFAFAAICACNKEAQPETPAVLENDAYVTINICTNSDGATRATSEGDFKEATVQESQVDVAYFVFYKDGAFNQVATGTGLEWNDGTDNENVDQKSTAKVILKAGEITPNQVLVVLNATSTIQEALVGESLEEAQKILGDFANDGNHNFVMSNSVYADATNEVIVATITSDNIQTTEANAVAEPVNVFVERVNAKVDVFKGATFNDKKITDFTPEGESSPVELSHKILGFALASVPTTSYLIKDVQPIITSGDYWANWTSPTNNRSYWAAMPTSALVYNQVTYTTALNNYNGKVFGTDNYVCYPQENTDQTNVPELLVAAQIVDGLGNGVTAYLYMGEMMNATQLKTKAVNQLAAAGLTYTVDKLDIVSASTGKAYDVKLALKAGEPVDANATEVLNNMGVAKQWLEGKCYFYTAIDHFGTKGSVDLKGIVRNHWYHISIDSIGGWGTPVTDPDEVIDPEKPTETYEYLAASINILNWKVVNQGVDLE